MDTTENEPLVYFDTPRPDRRPVTIRPHRAMFLRRQGQDALVPVAAGETITVEMDALARIAPEDFEIVGSPSPPITDHRQ